MIIALRICIVIFSIIHTPFNPTPQSTRTEGKKGKGANRAPPTTPATKPSNPSTIPNSKQTPSNFSTEREGGEVKPSIGH
ncbi:predicted protein [Plenodomus lingam JN3]|uniref:Predicted protein n=1 Tax=Leptosphaeria maculans (strain JN3 / isolate v23.1.3 / race Av1-4-5-6-7-8) TaxID=985895 RepID=E5ABW1_LEPMJ|nr:predicted protein [Plenodomus lingam JN3]CBY01152.1 predicted protein [Plenodomus lingam JN3]